MEQKNLVLTRLLEFIESKGGFSEVARNNMQEFARLCGVSQSQLSWWFVSDKFNLDTRERIAKALEEMEMKSAE